MNAAPIVSRVWSFCTTLRDDGVSYGDYLEQLTYLIFLKMADGYGRPPHTRDVGIPASFDWQSLKSKRGAELEGHYVTLLRELGTRRGMRGQIFTKAQNKIQDRRSCTASSTWWTIPTGSRSSPTSRATSTRACWRRTPRTPSPAPVNTSRRAP